MGLKKILRNAVKAKELLDEAEKIAEALSDGLTPDDALTVAKALGRVRRVSRSVARTATPRMPIYDDD